MRLVVGLGNPGAKYADTRHNLGFRVADQVARRLRIAMESEKFGARFGQADVAGERVVLLEPQTYMNLSGEAVSAAARFWKIDPTEILAVHDELDLDFGRVMLKRGGGNGGHNGVRSLIAHLGEDFVRVRCGIGRPPPAWDPADFVLAPFKPDEKPVAEEMVARASDAVMAALEEGVTRAMNKVNRKQKKEDVQ